MSTTSPREAASSEAARTQVSLNQQLFNVSYPELQSVLGRLQSDLGSGGEPSSVKDMFSGLRGNLNADYDRAGQQNPAIMSQRILQSGSLYTGAQKDAAISNAAIGLERDRSQANRNLNFQESSAGMTQFNQLMNLLGQGSGTALKLGQGFSGNQVGAIGGMSNTSEAGGALSGAMAGASLGSSVYPGWGTLIGGVLGGVGGYLGSS